jgi:hypothetical protein
MCDKKIKPPTTEAMEKIKQLRPGPRSLEYHAIMSHQRVSPGRKNKSSRYKGVCLMKKTGMWRARIKVLGEKNERTLGFFKYENDAAGAYNIAAESVFGENAVLNVIED